MSESATDLPDQDRISRALRALRLRAGMTQREAAQAHEPRITAQAWNKYEMGERKFTRDQLAATAAAVGVSVDELLERAGRDPGPPSGFQEAQRSFRPATSAEILAFPAPDIARLLGPSVRALHVADERMSPWAEPGETVYYDESRYPRRGMGCVVASKDGERILGLYKSSDGSNLFLDQVQDGRTLTIPLITVEGVYAVRLRGD